MSRLVSVQEPRISAPVHLLSTRRKRARADSDCARSPPLKLQPRTNKGTFVPVFGGTYSFPCGLRPRESYRHGTFRSLKRGGKYVLVLLILAGVYAISTVVHVRGVRLIASSSSNDIQERELPNSARTYGCTKPPIVHDRPRGRKRCGEARGRLFFRE